MNAIIQEKMEDLVALCARYHVSRLELFGSASKEEQFNSQGSDLDFLLEFQELPLGQYADAYFELLAELEKLFKRSVDLVMTRAIKNPYFLQEINASRVLLYAA